jgi:hypothetical protein
VLALLLTISSFAQAPEKMSYQAIVRAADNALVTNQQVGMQISILQGSTAVYEETQTPTSNTNRLVSLEIGLGTVISGSFTAIDWSADTYFIKIETDPTGGTDYTITGTSQLLSVPYALYAKTATNVSGIVAIVNGGTGSAAQNFVDITTDQSIAGDKTFTGAVTATNLSGKNTGDQDLSSLATNEAIALLLARIVALEKEIASIGDLRAGAVVFWVDPNDNTKGLVCAFEDQSTRIIWSPTSVRTSAKGTAIGTGAANTTAIIDVLGATEIDYAASLSRAYAGGGYTGRFLPSKDELNEIYEKRATLEAAAGFTSFSSLYWSSTEPDYDDYAWV